MHERGFDEMAAGDAGRRCEVEIILHKDESSYPSEAGRPSAS